MEVFDIKVHQANQIHDHLPLPLSRGMILSATHLNMEQPVEFMGQHSLLRSNMSQFPDSSPDFFQQRSLLPAAKSEHHHISHHIVSPNASLSSLPTDSAFDEAMREKRRRKMISNRESARRSRMRKKKRIEELESQVNQVQTVNHELSEKVIRLLECNHQVLQENVELKVKVSSLQIVISDLLTPMRNVEEITSITNCTRVEALNQPSNY